MKIRYIADMHFDHADIIPYDNRPFDSVEEMNRTMTENWNRVVSEDDLTWIVGDFCMGGAGRWAEILAGLKGRKALVLGRCTGLRQGNPFPLHPSAQENLSCWTGFLDI